MKPHILLRRIAGALLLVCGSTHAAAPTVPNVGGSVQYAFTPGGGADAMIIAAIAAARRQVLVQAYSFTHRRIAEALVSARNRGIDVEVIADHEQMRLNDTAAIRNITRSGVPLMLDSQHAAAHNKVIVIDAGDQDCAVVTGSYNFTYTAQHRNAENAVILRGNPPLCEAFRNNWLHHKAHSIPHQR